MTGEAGLYVARLRLDEPHAAGVRRKIEAQVAALGRALGPVRLAHPAAETTLIDGRPAGPRRSGALGRKLLYARDFYATVAAVPWTPSFVYVRYQRSTPWFVASLRRLRRRFPAMPILVELPSWPYATEHTDLRGRLLMAADLASRGGMAGPVDRIVTFSQAEEILGLRTIRTDNGVDVAALPVHAPTPLEDGEPLRLLGLANLSFWHGYDRVIEGLARHAAGGRAVVFEVVGAGAEFEPLKALAARHGLGEAVRFHGPLSGTALDAVSRSCHVAISSIGMHRLDVDTSNLKSREYCARGLPFVIGYPDRDFAEGFPFALQIPADDSPLDVAAVLAFHDRLRRERPRYPAEMHAYAEERLTWDAKMAPVVEAIRALHGRSA